MLILTPLDFPLLPAQGAATPVFWVRSADGQRVDEHGSSAASLLPADPEVVLVLPLRALSWHRLAVPKVAASRLRAVLDGLLEERVLSDTADLHFALEPGGRPGQTLWVAACGKAWLRGWLQALEAAGRPVARIVPALWPSSPEQPVLHWAHGSADAPWLASASSDGVRCLPLPAAASLLRMDNPEAATAAQWLADPAVATAAEQALDQRFEPMPLAGWLLRCAQAEWNLAQFDLSLSASARRGQRLRQTLRHFRNAPAWRAARWGLAALLLAHGLGLNMAAWQERQSLESKRLAVRQTLQQTFPHVTLVLDAPVQMQRELAQLQRASGQLGPGDLEAMLSAVGTSIPAQTPTPVQRLQYQAGELTLQTPAAASLASALQALGWQARPEGERLVLRPATTP